MPEVPASREELRRRLTQLETQNRDLQHVSAKFEAIFANVPASVYVFDDSGLITAVNAFHLERMGCGRTTPQDYIGHCTFDRPSMVAAGMSETLRRLLEGHAFDMREIHFPRTSGGAAMYVNMRGVPLTDGERIIGAALLTEDVTELVKVRRQLEHLNQFPHLKGLLPICARCKKIRDKVGTWYPVEVYIRDHSEVDFSHGLCPTCAIAVWNDDGGNNWEV